jgi:hypothetical protein
MIVQGSVVPTPIWIRYIDKNNDAIVKLTRNVIVKPILDSITNETINFYEYEETDLKISNRNNIEQYIQNNFDLLFEKGLSDYELKKQLEEKERQIKDLINNYKLLEVNQQLQDMNNIYGATLDSLMFDILPNLVTTETNNNSTTSSN